MAVNRWLLPTLTGWSLGRALFGIAVRRRDGAPVGMLRLAVRDLAHLLDTAAVFTGWLWPLWDRRNRTFADLLGCAPRCTRSSDRSATCDGPTAGCWWRRRCCAPPRSA